MERLSQALQLQKTILDYITEYHLVPLRKEMKSCPRPTLAQLAQELRLTRLIQILDSSLVVEGHLSRWFQALQTKVDRDIENQVEKTLSMIEKENERIRMTWTMQRNVPTEQHSNATSTKNNAPSSKPRGITRQNSTTKQSNPLLRRISYDLDVSIFHDDDNEDADVLRNKLEAKIAKLHRSLHKIISALKELVESICNRCRDNSSYPALGICGAFLYEVLLNFPQKYVLTEEPDEEDDIMNCHSRTTLVA